MSESEETKHDDRHDAVESLMWDVAARVLVLGVDVILDFGFWGKSQRDALRLKAHELGARFKIHFTDESGEVLLERLQHRNANLSGGTFHIPELKLKEWMQVFEPPMQEELY